MPRTWPANRRPRRRRSPHLGGRAAPPRSRPGLLSPVVSDSDAGCLRRPHHRCPVCPCVPCRSVLPRASSLFLVATLLYCHHHPHRRSRKQRRAPIPGASFACSSGRGSLRCSSSSTCCASCCLGGEAAAWNGWGGWGKARRRERGVLVGATRKGGGAVLGGGSRLGEGSAGGASWRRARQRVGE